MIISGLQIANFQRQIVKNEFLTANLQGESKACGAVVGTSSERGANITHFQTDGTIGAGFNVAWEVASSVKDKMSDLNAPFDFFLKECEKNAAQNERFVDCHEPNSYERGKCGAKNRFEPNEDLYFNICGDRGDFNIVRDDCSECGAENTINLIAPEKAQA